MSFQAYLVKSYAKPGQTAADFSKVTKVQTNVQLLENDGVILRLKSNQPGN